MKLLHLADLHLGKKLGEISLLKDQENILRQINKIIIDEKIEGVIISGDVYDRSIPSVDAVELFDKFLTLLAEESIPAFIIYGNHDSAERLGFCRKILDHEQIHIAGPFDGEVPKITLMDKYGKLNIYLMPNLKIQTVRLKYPNAEINTLSNAVKTVVGSIQLNKSERNIIAAHQFVVSGNEKPELSDSEQNTIGGIDEIPSSIFQDFDYTALGHLHCPQSVGKNCIRYSGSPLKYSASEKWQKKSASVIDIKEKGNIEITEIPLHPLKDLREIKGPLNELISDKVVNAANSDDYLYVILTDKVTEPDAQRKLFKKYSNIINIRFESDDTDKISASSITKDAVKTKQPSEIFKDFYEQQMGEPLNDMQKQIVDELFKEIKEESA